MYFNDYVASLFVATDERGTRIAVEHTGEYPRLAVYHKDAFAIVRQFNYNAATSATAKRAFAKVGITAERFALEFGAIVVYTA